MCPRWKASGDGGILPIRASWDFGGSSNWNCFINRGSAAGSRRISRDTSLVASDCLRRRGSVSRRSLSVIGQTSNNRWQASRAAIRARSPAAFKIPDQPDGYGIRVSLHTDNKQRRFAFIDWNSIQKDTEHVMIPGSVPMFTHSKTRSLLASIGDEAVASQFIELRIPPAPRKEDETWSDWIFATQRADLSPVSEPDRMALRYRVRPVDD
jgi:hypothetical protein